MSDLYSQKLFNWDCTRLRAVIALVLSICLLASFFHGWSTNVAGSLDPVATISVGSADGSVDDHSSPASSHADHCLTHIAGKLSRDVTPVSVLFGSRAFGLRQDRPLTRVAMLSPFKPPKA